MRDQLKQLEELQTHEAKIQELEQSLKAIPAKLASTEARGMLDAMIPQLLEGKKLDPNLKNPLAQP